MNEEQQQRLTKVIERIQAALDRGVEHFDRAGKRLGSVTAIVEAWVHEGGLTSRTRRTMR
jgi:hypothetical protein